MSRFLTHWLTTALALWVATVLVPGVSVRGVGALAVSALVLGLVNAVIRPVLQLLALPLTCLTLGLFYLVVNGLAFALAAAVVPAFHVRSFLSAFLGAIVVSLVSGFVGMFTGRPEPAQRE